MPPNRQLGLTLARVREAVDHERVSRHEFEGVVRFDILPGGDTSPKAYLALDTTGDCFTLLQAGFGHWHTQFNQLDDEHEILAALDLLRQIVGGEQYVVEALDPDGLPLASCLLPASEPFTPHTARKRGLVGSGEACTVRKQVFDRAPEQLVIEARRPHQPEGRRGWLGKWSAGRRRRSAAIYNAKEWLSASKPVLAEVYKPHSGAGGRYFLLRSPSQLESLIAATPKGHLVSLTRWSFRRVAVDDGFEQTIRRELTEPVECLIGKETYYPEEFEAGSYGRRELDSLAEDFGEDRGGFVCVGRCPEEADQLAWKT